MGLGGVYEASPEDFVSTSAIGPRPSPAANLIEALKKLKANDGDADDTKAAQPPTKTFQKQGVGQIVNQLV